MTKKLVSPLFLILALFTGKNANAKFTITCESNPKGILYTAERRGTKLVALFCKPYKKKKKVILHKPTSYVESSEDFSNIERELVDRACQRFQSEGYKVCHKKDKEDDEEDEEEDSGRTTPMITVTPPDAPPVMPLGGPFATLSDSSPAKKDSGITLKKTHYVTIGKITYGFPHRVRRRAPLEEIPIFPTIDDESIFTR